MEDASGVVLRSGVRLGRRIGPFEGRLDSELVDKFAEATGDPSGRARSARGVPPVAVVTQLWDAQEAGRAALIPEEFQSQAIGGVHGDHDLVVLRRIRPGEPLQTWVEGRAARTKGSNSVITLRYVTTDARGEVLAEQLWSTVWLGVRCLDIGEAPPPHGFPDAARARHIGSWHVDVDGEMARRYAELSGDWSRHHFDAEAARRSGAERPFLHGLCSMALCARGFSETVAGGDQERVGRIALRFAGPVPLGERLTVHFYDAGRLGYAFEADVDGTRVVSHGRAAWRGTEPARANDR
jgi:acyl dehydratase